jgi:hypothetical protein
MALKMAGLDVNANLTNSGRLFGFSFRIYIENEQEKRAWIKGSILGSDYALQGLIDRGLKYNSEQNYKNLTDILQRPSFYRENISEIEIDTVIEAGNNNETIIWKRKDFSEKAKQFNLLYWPVAGGISFWTQPGGKGKERGSLVMIDRGNRIEVPLFHDDRLRLVLRYAAEKWTTLKIGGDENFVQKAETYAKELHIPVISQREIMPNLFQYFRI